MARSANAESPQRSGLRASSRPHPEAAALLDQLHPVVALLQITAHGDCSLDHKLKGPPGDQIARAVLDQRSQHLSIILPAAVNRRVADDRGMGRLGVDSSFGPEVSVHDGFAVRQPTEEGNVKRDAVGCDHARSACVWEEWPNEHDDARN